LEQLAELYLKYKEAQRQEDRKKYYYKGGSYISRGVPFGPGFISMQQEEKKELSGEEKQYFEKYKEYTEFKVKKDEFACELAKKEDWDKYTKGVDSLNTKGLELKEIAKADANCQFSSLKVKAAHKVSKEDKYELMFDILRQLYNSIDTVFVL
jgi:hypothetical protein